MVCKRMWTTRVKTSPKANWSHPGLQSKWRDRWFWLKLPCPIKSAHLIWLCCSDRFVLCTMPDHKRAAQKAHCGEKVWRWNGMAHPHPNCEIWQRGIAIWACAAASGPGWKLIKTGNLEMHYPPTAAQQRICWCNRTTTRCREVNDQQNGFGRRKDAFWSSPVRVLASTQLRSCGMMSAEHSVPNSFVKRNAPKYLN